MKKEKRDHCIKVVHRGDNDTTIDLSEEMENKGREKTKKKEGG